MRWQVSGWQSTQRALAPERNLAISASRVPVIQETGPRSVGGPAKRYRGRPASREIRGRVGESCILSRFNWLRQSPRYPPIRHIQQHQCRSGQHGFPYRWLRKTRISKLEIRNKFEIETPCVAAGADPQ